MEKKLYEVCRDILKSKSETEKFTQLHTVDEMYEYFAKHISTLSEEEFDSFLVDALEDYKQIQNASKAINDKPLENVAGGFNVGTKIASGAFALSFLIPSVGATSKTLNNINIPTSTSILKNPSNTDSATQTNSAETRENSGFFSKYFNSKKLSEKFQKTKNWIKRHKKAVITTAILAALAAPSIYSHIKYSTPRKITPDLVGESDTQISRYYAYNHTFDDIQYSKNKAQIESKVNEIIDEMNKHNCKSDYEKAIFLHDYIYKHCEFDMGRALDFFANTNRFRSEGCHDESGCLLNNRAVCSGISQAYALLLNRTGIECKYINGYSYGMYHAWNIVKINGRWYHVDITWDLLFKAAHGKYAWFMLTESEIKKDHTPDIKQVIDINKK